MAAKTPKNRGGRPKSPNPKTELVGVRLDGVLKSATETYRVKYFLDDAPSAIRHMMRRMLETERIIEAKK